MMTMKSMFRLGWLGAGAAVVVMMMMLPGSSMAFSSAPSFLSKKAQTTKPLCMSDFSDFAYIDDDEDLESSLFEYAEENDTQEHKAQVGAALLAPEIENDAEPIVVPQGSVLPLTVENVCGLLSACREEIGTMFGYSAENRGVGITGGVDFVELDGPMVVLRLKGRFWHQRPTVLVRVGAYLQSRIPEIIDVIIEDEYQLTDEANAAAE